MRYLLLLITCIVFSQEKVGSFSNENRNITFVDFLENEHNHYLLTFEKLDKEELFYWKIFDSKHHLLDEEIPFKVNSKPFFELFDKNTSILIEQTKTPVKKVFFLKQKKKIFTLYKGELNINDLEKGIYNVKKHYDLDLHTFSKNKIRVFKTNNHFSIIALGINKKTINYYKLSENEEKFNSFRLANSFDFNEVSFSVLEGTVLQEGISSKYFPDGKGILFRKDSLVLFYPNNITGAPIYQKNPIKIISFDFTNNKMRIEKVNIEKGTALDYAVLDNQVFIGCRTKKNVDVYSYDLQTNELYKINSINEANSSSYTFYYSSYFLDYNRNRVENTSFDKWYKSLNKTLVLDVDRLDNGLLEFNISGAKYRDPDGVAKILGTILIGSLTGVGVAPIFERSNLQPLLTSTSFVLFPEEKRTQPIKEPQKEDNIDKIINNNGYFRGVILVGALSEEVLIFKIKNSKKFVIIDFSKPLHRLK